MQEHTLDDSSLRDHLGKSHYAKILTSLINWTQKEIEMLQDMINTIKDIGMRIPSYFTHNFFLGIIFVNTTKEFMAYIEETGVAHAVCYSIQSFQAKLLMKHLTDIDGYKLEPCSLDSVRDKYFYELSQQISSYTSFAVATCNRANTSSCAVIFVVIFDAVTAQEQILVPQGNSYIQLYSKSTGQFTAVTSAIFSKPQKPTVKTIRSTSVTLLCPSWNIPSSKGYNIHDGYYGIVSYYKSNSENMLDVHVPFSENMVTVAVDNLEPFTTYYFKLAIQCPCGISEYSDISDPITTLLARPEKPEIQRVKGKLKISIKPLHNPGNLKYEYDFRISKLTIGGESIYNYPSEFTSIEVPNLLSDHVYKCTVVAKARRHISEPSEERQFIPNDFTEIGKYNYNTGMYIAKYFVILGEALLVNCLGMPFKLGVEYNYCYHKVHNIVSSKDTKKSKMQPKHMSALHFIDSDSLYSKCNIDEYLQLCMYTGLIKMGESANRLMHYFSNRSVALHFHCVTEIENLCPSKCSNQATHVVGEVRYGLEAFFIIDQDAHQFENDMIFRSKIENAIENKSFDEVADVCGTLVLFANEKFSLPREVKTIKDMIFFYSFIKKLLQEKQINGIPIAVKLHPFKRIGSVPTTQLAPAVRAVQNLHSAIIKCAQMLKASLLTQGVKVGIEIMSQCIQDYTKKINENIANVLSKIYDGSKSVSELTNILQKHLKSPLGRELNVWIANTSKAITTFQKHFSSIQGKSY